MKRVLLLGGLLALGACGDQSALPPITTLSPEKANDIAAGYSPDGARIYWWQQDGQQWALWVSPADMSAPERLPITSLSNNGTPLWSPDGSRFAISTYTSGLGFKVWVMDTTPGSAPRRLQTGEGLAQGVAWHPDGKRIAYATILNNGDVVGMAVSVDSGTPYRMVPEEVRPHWAYWSPDGSLVAVQIMEPGRSSIALADSAGGNIRQLTTEGFERLWDLPWSPDGTALLYTTNRTGAADIWLLPVDGDSARPLTNDVRDDNSPVWSPDGRWIAFFSNRGQQSDLWIMPAVGGSAERVTDDVLVETLSGWRPGTQELVYTTGRTVSAVWTHTLSDGSERQLTPDSATVSSFNLSPDDQVEVTFNRGGGVNDFAVLPLSGGEPQVILPNSGGRVARWSPDGSMLAFQSDRGGSQDIWVMDAAGGVPRQLTSWPGAEEDPRWSADGTEVYFRADRETLFGDAWRVSAAGGEPVRVTTNARVIGLEENDIRASDFIVQQAGSGRATFKLLRVQGDGSMQTLWDRSLARVVGRSPATDSVAIIVFGDNAPQTLLLSLNGGEGRPLLEPGQTGQVWSPDGKEMVYRFLVGEAGDLGILTLADGSTRRITETPESEGGTEWSADGSTLVFQRSVPINRITTANLTKLLAAPH
jgi:Tol biopolymer transport system component